MIDRCLLPPVDPCADDVYHVYSVRYAHVAHRRVHDNFVRRDMHDGPMPVDFNFWIVRNALRTVLVDTGYGPRAAARRGRPLDIDPIQALDALGIDPDRIGDVIITHLHYDHAGNIDRLGAARFHVQQAEAGHATGACMCEPHLRAPYDVEDIVTFVRHVFAERATLHAGDASPLPGITLHVLPGHSPGMQAVRINTPRGHVVLASDASHYYANMLRRAPFPGNTDAMAMLRSYGELQRLVGGDVGRIIPGHDPKVRRLFPRYEYGGVEVTALHEEPAGFDLVNLARVDDFAST